MNIKTGVSQSRDCSGFWRMKCLAIFVTILTLCLVAQAGTAVNTVASDNETAISSLDAVAFFTEKKALQGNDEFAHSYNGARWLFSSQANLDLFQQNPDKYMLEWGGQCAWCISEGCISNKKLSGEFDFVKGKLYLYAPGNNTKSGARDGFWRSGGGPGARIHNGDKNWVGIKEKLEDGSLRQANSSSYRKTPFD